MLLNVMDPLISLSPYAARRHGRDDAAVYLPMTLSPYPLMLLKVMEQMMQLRKVPDCEDWHKFAAFYFEMIAARHPNN